VGAQRTAFERVRIYETLRTAHLERAHELVPASIVYRTRRYDFDTALADGLDLVEAGPLATALVLARSRVRELEVNEPLMVSSLRRTVLAVLVVRARGVLLRYPTRVVTYAIANDDPFRPPPRPGLRGRARRLLDRVLIRLVAGQVDRIAYGTHAARDLYARAVPVLARAEQRLVPALPSPCTCGEGVGPTSGHEPPDESGTRAAGATGRVVFVGAFEERKGVPELVAAWPGVVERLPGARLTLVGKGPLLGLVEALVGARAEVELVVDPPRARIHEVLRGADVLVLVSQRTRTWREQVGLPVLEGLAHGCTVVTSTETGLADWLTEHGHTVLDPTVGPDALAAAVAAALVARRPAEDVRADLPARDGRLEADAWLFARADERRSGSSSGF
jgi:glycosyltransferase involved in cell wall biosynthesis